MSIKVELFDVHSRDKYIPNKCVMIEMSRISLYLSEKLCISFKMKYN